MMRLASFGAFCALRVDTLDLLSRALVAQLHLLKSSTGLFGRLGFVNYLLCHLIALSVCDKTPARNRDDMASKALSIFRERGQRTLVLIGDAIVWVNIAVHYSGRRAMGSLNLVSYFLRS
jgi:hypothetical protein